MHFFTQLLEKLQRLDALETAFAQALEAEKLESLAEFAAGAGHDINNPLAVISGRAQLLLRTEKDPERRRDLALINSQALRVHEMIGDLMLFARPPRPELALVDCRAILEKLVEELGPRAQQQCTEIVLSAGDGCVAMVDPTQILVALRAICDNALQALGSEGRIDIRAQRCERPLSDSRSAIEIHIRDTGPGIAPEVRRHLFDPFYSGRGAGRGVGMGLAKCWRIVTNHGGTIGVQS